MTERIKTAELKRLALVLDRGFGNPTFNERHDAATALRELIAIRAHTAELPAPDAVAKADETRLFVPRGTGCASDQCNRPASLHFIRGGVGSYYCAACYITIQSQGKRP